MCVLLKICSDVLSVCFWKIHQLTSRSSFKRPHTPVTPHCHIVHSSTHSWKRKQKSGWVSRNRCFQRWGVHAKKQIRTMILRSTTRHTDITTDLRSGLLMTRYSTWRNPAVLNYHNMTGWHGGRHTVCVSNKTADKEIIMSHMEGCSWEKTHEWSLYLKEHFK